MGRRVTQMSGAVSFDLFPGGNFAKYSGGRREYFALPAEPHLQTRIVSFIVKKTGKIDRHKGAPPYPNCVWPAIQDRLYG